MAELWWSVFNMNLVSVQGSNQATYTNLSFSNATDLGLRITLIGNGFAFSNGNATAGTLNQLELLDANGTLLSRITLTSGVSLTTYLSSNTSSDQAFLLFNGNDVFNGQSGADYLVGFGGSDTLNGAAGDDFLSPGSSLGNSAGYIEPQADVVDGGAGTDTVFLDYRNRTSGFNLAFTTQQTATGQTLSDGTILRNIENVQIAGGSGNDTISGGSGDDLIMGGAGADLLMGGNGNDTLAGFALPRYGFNGILEADTLDGGAGNDTAYLGAQAVLTAMSVDFTLASTAAGVLINGLTRVQNIENIDFTGGNGNDSIVGGTGADTLSGGEGIDTIRGGAGNDLLAAPNSNILGAVGTAVLDGGTGIDMALLQLNPGTYQFGSIGTSTGQTFTLANGLQALVLNMEAVGISNFGLTPGFYDLVLTGYDDDVFLFGSYSGNVDAGAGDDEILLSGSQASTVYGGSGNDDIETGSGNDSLDGGTDDDTLDGVTGNDTLTGGTGNDLFFYSSGLDTITDFMAGGTDDKIDLTAYSSLTNLSSVLALGTQSGANVILTFGAGNTLKLNNVTLSSLTAADFSLLPPPPTVYIGTPGDDTMTGSSGNDTLTGLAGNDLFINLRGLDTITDFTAGGTDDRIDVTALASLSDFAKAQGLASQVGADTIITLGFNNVVTLKNVTLGALTAADFVLAAAAPNNPINGTAGPDTLTGTAGVDSITGGTGNDTLGGFVGADTLVAGDGNDYLYGGADNDLLDGGNDLDVLIGEGGDDILLAGAGTDYLYGGTGNNVMAGNAGLDVFISEGAFDIMNGGEDRGYFYRYAAGSSQSFGGSDIDIFVGGAFASNDLFLGYDGQDYGYGGDGNDELIGGAGNDVLIGQNGDDTLEGGAGINTLWANDTGNDQIRVNVADAGTQVVEFFEAGGLTDTVRLIGSNLTSFADYQALLANVGNAVNNNLLLNTGAGAQLYLNLGANQTAIWFQGISAYSLTAADFTFG